MCMIDGADDDWLELSWKRQRARITHVCVDCGRIIEPGEIYVNAVYLSYGSLHQMKHCEHCEAVASHPR